MEKIRIGKDIVGRWNILTNHQVVALEGRDLTLELKSPVGEVMVLPLVIEGVNTIVFTFHGIDQKNMGTYSLTLWENKGKVGQTAVDKIQAFTLVADTEKECTNGESQGCNCQ